MLVNLGTPDAPTARAVRRYLKEFLSDKRVVELPAWLWQPLLRGIILQTRPRRSARLYQSIWTPEGSPILAISQSLTAKLHEHPGLQGIPLVLAMRYGNPDIRHALRQLQENGVNRLLVIPMYPQYAACTTASIFDAVSETLRDERNIPELIFLRNYHEHPLYLHAIATSIEAHWQENGSAERLLFSFHGIPEAMAASGDPYPDECRATAEAVAQLLSLEQDRWTIGFQSRFGPAAWVRPYTDEQLVAWAKEGVQSVDVVCPGFAIDCLETLEEIAVENALLFKQSGGQSLRYIPALNDSELQTTLFSALIQENLLPRPSE
jgi:ferrochelatase